MERFPKIAGTTTVGKGFDKREPGMETHLSFLWFLRYFDMQARGNKRGDWLPGSKNKKTASMKQTSAPPMGRIHMASMRNYNPSPRVRLEGGVFWVRGSYPYPIEEDRIENERDLLAWVRHLSRKTWTDRK
jgi:hypothetical protein